MYIKNHLAVVMLVFTCLTVSVFAENDKSKNDSSLDIYPKKTKKIIEWGWDMPTPDYIRKNIHEMEQRPFDGLIFWLRIGCNGVEGPLVGEAGCIFVKNKWKEAKFSKIFDDCKNIKWQKFTDNYVSLYAAAEPGWDWFNDADWEATEHNLGIIVKAAALARCRGIHFDCESNNGLTPWDYREQAQAKEKTFAEYEAKVRQRGAEFVKTISKYMPKCVIHTTFLLSYFQNIMNVVSPEVRSERLSKHPYSLLPAFINGMLDAAGPDMVFVDGNEDAYYYERSEDYYRGYQMMRQRATILIAPENMKKYKSQVQAGNALYADYVFGLLPQCSPATLMTPEERAAWFEHNVYYALSVSDEYVWLYSERMNWWKNNRLPAGIIKATKNAQENLNGNKGFDNQNCQDAFTNAGSKLKHRTATVVRFETPPEIDGKLDDKVWKKAMINGDFSHFSGNKTRIEANTQISLGYDDQNLYLAFHCIEPKLEKMHIGGIQHDGNIWGDVVEIFLAQGSGTNPLVHLVLNPHNGQWDALNPARILKCFPDIDISFNPKWRSATHIGKDEWTAEIAIPWKEVNIPVPAAGKKIRANFCRTRIPGDGSTTWSQNFSWFGEDDNLGTLKFK